MESIRSLPDLKELELALNAFEQAVSLETLRYDKLVKELYSLGDSIHKYSDALAICERCLQEQADVRVYVEAQITAILRKVFSPDFEFKFEAIFREDGVSLRGLKPCVKKGGVWDDLRAYGDGVRNVVSFAMRLVILILSRGVAKVLVFDEPLLNLNASRWAPLVDFIIDLQTYFNVQIIVITHVHAQFPETYRVFRNGKISQVERIETD